MSSPFISRLVEPEVFHFLEVSAHCPYWTTTGKHIVIEGACRCGKRFRLVEYFVSRSLTDEVASLAGSLAYEVATGYIESACYPDGKGWLNVADVENVDTNLVDYFRYLQLRGLIERKDGAPHLIKFREESEATS